MSKNILWQNLSARQIQQMIRTWPTAGQTVQTEIIKFPKKTGASKIRQKHTGADGEVKYVEHRKIWLGFYGGKAVVKRSTAQAAREWLVAQYPCLSKVA